MLIHYYKCNKCGEEFTNDDCLNNPFEISHDFGYESKNFDNKRLRIHLCPDCLDEQIDKWIVEFKLNLF